MPTKKYFINEGDVFGSLLVLDSNIKGSNCLVKCICGTEKLVRSNKIAKGLVISCGQKQCNPGFINLSGNKFGFLTLIREIKVDIKKHGIKWECKCDCGNIIFVRLDQLKSGNTKSCGCKILDLKFEKHPKKSLEERAIKAIFAQYESNARKRKLEFNLSISEFKTLILQNCYYCNSDLSNIQSIKRVSDNIEFKYNGIDRVNSNLGYYLENCVACCHLCNRAKSNISYEKFLDWINQLILFRSN